MIRAPCAKAASIQRQNELSNLLELRKLHRYFPGSIGVNGLLNFRFSSRIAASDYSVVSTKLYKLMKMLMKNLVRE